MAAISLGTVSAAESAPVSLAPPDQVLNKDLAGLDDRELLDIVRVAEGDQQFRPGRPPAPPLPVAGAEAGPSHPRADQDHGHAGELVQCLRVNRTTSTTTTMRTIVPKPINMGTPLGCTGARDGEPGGGEPHGGRPALRGVRGVTGPWGPYLVRCGGDGQVRDGRPGS
jgi:hypothetical protein